MAARKRTKPKATKPTTSTSIAATVVSSLPPLTDAERTELLAQFTDEQCEAWAVRTKASDTLRDANKWLASLHRVVNELAPEEYGALRLAFVAELVLALETANEDPATGVAPEEARAARDVTFLRALGVRQRLVEALSRTAGGRVPVKKRISAAGRARTPTEALESLQNLITLARQELRDSPVASRVSGLQGQLVTDAEVARTALDRDTATAASAVIGIGDSAQTNRLEGRVLRELRLAWTSVRDARERDGRVPVLVPGPTLVRAFKLIDSAQPA